MGTSPVQGVVGDLAAWARTADELDECEAANVLWAALAFLGTEQDRVACAPSRVMNFLLSGRAGEAAGVVDRLDDSARQELGDVIPGAVAAARGDDGAWSRLLNLAATGASVPVLYLLAGVAECRGDAAVADQVWLTLREEARRNTGLVRSRAALADVVRTRDEPHCADRAQAVYSAACDLTPTDEVTRDPRWALGAIDGLVRRGDPGGARLLAETICALSDTPPARVQEEARRLAPLQSMRQYRVRMAVAYAALLSFLWLGVLGSRWHTWPRRWSPGGCGCPASRWPTAERGAACAPSESGPATNAT